MKCPECGYENIEDVLCCNLCGLVFKKEKSEKKPIDLPPPRENLYYRIKEDYPKLFLLSESFFLGSFLYFLTTKIAVLYFIFVYTLAVFFTHEVGHTIAGLLFGNFSIPAFSLFGGITFHFPGTILFPITIVVGILSLTIIFRKEKWVIPVGITLIILYSLFAFTYLKDVFISAGGHLSTALIAGLFLTKGVWEEKKGVEGLSWEGLGGFLVIEELVHFIKLKIDVSFREGYLSGALFGSYTTGDLAKIAQSLNLNFDLIVNLFILFAFVIPCLVLLVARYLKSYLQ